MISIYPSAGITLIFMKLHIGVSYSNLSKLFDFGYNWTILKYTLHEFLRTYTLS